MPGGRARHAGKRAWELPVLLSTDDGMRSDDRGARPSWASVPWRTIVATVAIVAVAVAVVALCIALFRVITLILAAGFFAVVLAPGVRRVERWVGHRRAPATAIVMLSAALIMLGSVVLFVWPVRAQLIQTASDLPGTVDDAASGTGPFGNLVNRLGLENFVRDHQDDLDRWVADLQGSSLEIARKVLGVLVSIVTVLVLTFLFLTQAGNLGRAALELFPPRRRPMITRVVKDCGAAVSGYMLGNLLISLVAGLAAFVCLLALGVPNPIVLALWVAFFDLIPLVGATIGAAVAVFAAFLHAPSAGIVSLIFFIVYQQFENSVLQPVVMARTVRVNPLIVIISVLVGVELMGFAGALLAIPVAGSLQVAAKGLWHERNRERLEVRTEPPP
jgi:predicted PurR-regulated permease PerM